MHEAQALDQILQFDVSFIVYKSFMKIKSDHDNHCEVKMIYLHTLQQQCWMVNKDFRIFNIFIVLGFYWPQYPLPGPSNWQFQGNYHECYSPLKSYYYL